MCGKPGDIERGRTRVVALALLVVGIGLLGAILLPRLIHDGGPTGPATASASICFVGGKGGAPRGGMVRLVARGPGGDRFLDIEEPIAQHASAVATAAILADGAKDAGWDVSQEGACLYLDRIDEVGGTPGRTGIGMALGLSVESSGSASYRLRVEEGRPDTSKSGRFTPTGPVEEPVLQDLPAGRGYIVLTAQSPAEQTQEAGGEPAVLLVTYDLADEPAAVHLALTRELGRTGWSYDVDEGVPPHVVLRRGPHGRPIGAILLTLGQALEDGQDAGEPHPLLFVVGLAAE